MLDSPAPPLRGTRAVLWIALWIAFQPWHALAQSQGPGTVMLRDGSRLQGTILLYIPGKTVVLERDGRKEVYDDPQLAAVDFSPAAATPAIDAAMDAGGTQAAALQMQLFRAYELARLYDQRDALRATNRRWQVPAVGLSLGVASILTGATMMMLRNAPGACSCYDYVCSDGCSDGVNWAMDRAGMVMLPVGGALVLINTPLLIVRAVRSRRLHATEATIRRLGGELSLLPLLTPRGDAGLGAKVAF
jgi:hypothetical protein